MPSTLQTQGRCHLRSQYGGRSPKYRTPEPPPSVRGLEWERQEGEVTQVSLGPWFQSWWVLERYFRGAGWWAQVSG